LGKAEAECGSDRKTARTKTMGSSRPNQSQPYQLSSYTESNGREDPMVIIFSFKIRFRYISESNMPPFWGELICNHDVLGIERKPGQE
jgi:hypothetical protein